MTWTLEKTCQLNITDRLDRGGSAGTRHTVTIQPGG